MKNTPKELDILKKKIEDYFGLTPETKSDYERLATRISNKLKEVFSAEKELYTPRVSGATISRIWGYAKSDGEISKTTWSTLARSLGYKGWEDFCNSDHSDHKDNVNNEPATTVEESAVDSSNDSSVDDTNNEPKAEIEEKVIDANDESAEKEDGLPEEQPPTNSNKETIVVDVEFYGPSGVPDDDELYVGYKFILGWHPVRYVKLEYLDDHEYKIIKHVTKGTNRENTIINAHWFELINVVSDSDDFNSEQDIAGVVWADDDKTVGVVSSCKFNGVDVPHIKTNVIKVYDRIYV